MDFRKSLAIFEKTDEVVALSVRTANPDLSGRLRPCIRMPRQDGLEIALTAPLNSRLAADGIFTEAWTTLDDLYTFRQRSVSKREIRRTDCHVGLRPPDNDRYRCADA